MSENNIKEDIKWIEKIIKKCDDCGLHECIACEICWTEVQAIKHVLKDYKKLQEEFKEVDHECERLEEKEVRLIKENEELKEKNKKEFTDFIKIKREQYDEYLEKLNKLIKQRQELSKENKELEEINNQLEAAKNEVIRRYNFETVPIQKIKDKIRKNEEIIDISNDGDLIHELYQENKVYEELLESEE